MAKIVSTAEWRKRTRDDLTAEILHHDRHPVPDVETDRAIAALNKLFDETPMADEEKLVLAYTKLVELLAAIDDETERTAYVKRITTLLNQDAVEAAREAFPKF
jgi:DnaB-helicase binding domain of primase